MNSNSHMILAYSSRFVLGMAVLLGPGDAAWAQQRHPPPGATPSAQATATVEEAADIAAGWTLLAQGQTAQASSKVTQILARYPRSGAALVLAVEVDIARAGALSGLDRYERWLGGRTLEEPAVLHRIARAVLRETLAQRQDASLVIEAWRGLIQDGALPPVELEAMVALNNGTARALAAAGDEGAVRTLVAELRDGTGNPSRTIEALGASGSRLAVDALVAALRDSRMEVRGMALDALGGIGGPDLVTSIKPLLSDRSVFVRAKAAGAMLRLGDDGGVEFLETLAADAVPSIRLLAAEGLASQPNATWNALVRDLAGSQDAEVRASVARFVAMQDPELARSVLDSLLADPNPALRDLAAINYGHIVASCDLATLRRLLRQSLPLTKVRAAVKILALLR